MSVRLGMHAGARCFFDGLSAVRAPGLRRYTWLPALVSLVVVAAGLTVTLTYADRLTAWLSGLLPEWLSFLSAALTPLVYLLALLAGTWLFALLAVLTAGPFMGDLSLAVERGAFGTGPPQPPSFWSGLASGIARELRKLLYYLPRLLLIFLLTLIPLLNALAPVLWFVFGAWILAVQFCDYPLENRGRPFRDTVALLKHQRLAALGFGACATVALAIPLVNFLLIPAAVAGGTLLWGRSVDPAGR